MLHGTCLVYTAAILSGPLIRGDSQLRQVQIQNKTWSTLSYETLAMNDNAECTMVYTSLTGPDPIYFSPVIHEKNKHKVQPHEPAPLHS